MATELQLLEGEEMEERWLADTTIEFDEGVPAVCRARMARSEVLRAKMG
jgi:hypothetical protein